MKAKVFLLSLIEFIYKEADTTLSHSPVENVQTTEDDI